MTLLTLFKRDEAVPGRFKAHWLRVLDFIAGIHFRISHIFREGNQSTDFWRTRIVWKESGMGLL